MASAGADGIGSVIDVFAVVALELALSNSRQGVVGDVLAYVTVGGSCAKSGCLSQRESQVSALVGPY